MRIRFCWMRLQILDMREFDEGKEFALVSTLISNLYVEDSLQTVTLSIIHWVLRSLLMHSDRFLPACAY